MRRNTDWDDDRVDPLKGPNRPTEFLKANFKILSTGRTFRTVKQNFPEGQLAITPSAPASALKLRTRTRG